MSSEQTNRCVAELAWVCRASCPVFRLWRPRL